jgi:hypothetical protein
LNRVARFAVLLAVVAAAAGLYAPALDHELVLDDPLVTVLNDDVAVDPPRFGRFFLTSLYAGTDFESQNGNLYRPVAKSTFALDYLRSGSSFDSRALHWSNLLLYALCAALLFELVLLLAPGAGAVPRAAAVALLFVVFPSHLETVTIIKHREEMLALLFGLGAWIVAERGRSRNRWSTAVLAAVLLLLALLSKESAVLIAGVVLLHVWGTRDPAAKGARVPRFVWTFVAAVAVYGALRWIALGVPLSPPGTRSFFAQESGALARVFTSSVTFWHYYVWDQIVGVGLDPTFSSPFVVHRAPLISPANVVAFAAYMAGLGLSAFAWLRWRSTIAFAAAFVFVTSLLTLNVIPTGTAGAFRLQFTPSVGICMVIVLTIERLVARPPSRGRVATAAAVCAALVLSYGWVTRSRMPVFMNDGTIAGYSAFVEPRNPLSPFAQGQFLGRSGDRALELDSYAESVRRFQAFEADPERFDERSHDAYSVVATEVAFARVRESPEEAVRLADVAIAQFEHLRVLRGGLIDTNTVAPFYVKALALSILGRTEEAIAVGRAGLAITAHGPLTELMEELES